MEFKNLTVNETLRFANHDFLNELQIISMQLQLGKVDEALQFIERISLNSSEQSKLHKFPLLLTTEWLLTAKWRFPECQFKVRNGLVQEVELHQDVDMQIVQYLEETMIQLQKIIDPFTEQMISIDIKDAEKIFLHVAIKGKWTESIQLLSPTELLQVKVIENTSTDCQFTIEL